MIWKSLLALVGVAGAMAFAPGAWAQEGDDPEPAPWIVMKTTSGCTFYLYDYDDPSGSWQKQWPWSWSGACTGGVATGQGELEAAMKYDDGGKYTSGYRGLMVGGRLNGRVEEITNGKMPADYYHQNFEMGCGDAAQFVYCKPYTGKVETPKAVKVTTANLTPKQLSAAEPAAIRADLGVSTEDRIIAVLNELALTGEINVLQQVNSILARRFPNSPFLPIAMEMVNTLNNGDKWTGQKAAASTPPPAPMPSTQSTVSSAPAAGALGVEDVRRMAEAEFGPATDITGTSATKVYEITLTRGGFNVPIAIEVSGSGKYVWLSTTVGDGNLSGERAQVALKRITQIQPTMIWDTGKKLRMGAALENRALTQSVIKDAMERVANDVANNSDVWK